MSDGHQDALADAARLLSRRVGFHTDPSVRGRLSHSVTAAAKAHHLPVPDYVAALDRDPAALQDLLDRVTVQETAFFRDPAQFAALAEQVLPSLPAPTRIWSAACANGQEAYTIAMVLDEVGHGGSTVVATDISSQALDRTRQARYSSKEIRGLSAERRERYLSAVDGKFEIVPAMRERVDVARHNLIADQPPVPAGSCSIVFCRNVLIYFSHDEVVKLLDRLADWMAPGGWLFLGYSETLWQVSDRFDLVRCGEAFLYRRHDGTGVPAPQRRRPAAPARPATKRPLTARRPSPPAAAPTPPTAVELLAAGEAAIQAGDNATAITAFRKCTYLDPDQPVGHLYLGLALEASGDGTAARRAFAAAKRALEIGETGVLESTLEGYHPDELVRLLDLKLAAER